MDRNYYVCEFASAGRLSLSARRAWIEIAGIAFVLLVNGVALRKESVDRNRPKLLVIHLYTVVALRKESVDRNHYDNYNLHCVEVALRKESVDRNRLTLSVRLLMFCRSPQGERG